MKLRTAIGVMGVSAVLGVAAAVGASVPVGIYAVVDKVVVEPSAAEPQRIQVWGTFALWDDRAGAGYRAPVRGYLYYACSREQIAMCRNEWADLKAVAGKDETVGFGSRSLGAGRVRKNSEAVSAPDTYPIQFGVVNMGSPRGAIFDRLRATVRGE
jgi:hypothetical protein